MVHPLGQYSIFSIASPGDWSCVTFQWSDYNLTRAGGAVARARGTDKTEIPDLTKQYSTKVLVRMEECPVRVTVPPRPGTNNCEELPRATSNMSKIWDSHPNYWS